MNDREIKEMNDKNLNGENHGKSKWNIFSVLFLVWFFGSIISLFFVSEENPHIAVMIFGQYFFVFGLIPLFAKGEGKWISIPFIGVGLACIIIPFLMMNPHLISANINWETVIPLLIILVFVIVGLCMVIFPILNKKKKEKRCIYHVFATIVGHETTYGDSGELYAPIYKYEYNKKTYEVCTEMYSNIGVKEVGTIIDLMINPDNPKEFLDNSNFSKLLIIMGMLFLIASVPVLIYILSTMEFFL